LLELGAELETRNLDAQPLSEQELNDLIGKRDYKPFLYSRNESYRSRNMAKQVSSRQDAIRLMSKNLNLIQRPVVVRGDHMVLGVDVTAYMGLLK